MPKPKPKSETPLQLDLLAPERAADAPEVKIRVRRTARAGASKVRIRREGDVLEVSAPQEMSRENIEHAVRERMESPAPTSVLPDLPQEWAEGTCLSYLGGVLTLRLGRHAPAVRCWAGELVLPLPEDAESSRIRDQVHAWLQSESRWVLGEHLAACAERLGCPAPDWKVTFSNKMLAGFDGGVLRLHWKLLLLGPAEIDAVISRALVARPVVDAAGSLFDNTPE